MFTNCRRCGRKLLTQRSRDLGYGVVCLARITRAVRSLPVQPSPTQLEKAFDALMDGAVVAFRSIYKVQSSRGTHTYTTTSRTCSCPAASHDRMCWHLVAVTIARV